MIINYQQYHQLSPHISALKFVNRTVQKTDTLQSRELHWPWSSAKSWWVSDVTITNVQEYVTLILLLMYIDQGLLQKVDGPVWTLMILLQFCKCEWVIMDINVQTLILLQFCKCACCTLQNCSIDQVYGSGLTVVFHHQHHCTINILNHADWSVNL